MANISPYGDLDGAEGSMVMKALTDGCSLDALVWSLESILSASLDSIECITSVEVRIRAAYSLAR